MDLGAAARRAGSVLAGDDTVERTAALASAVTVGTSFGPGLLPRPGLDQALATGIIGATEHGLVMTSQSACAALARRFVADDGTPIGPGAELRGAGGRQRRCCRGGLRGGTHAGGAA